MLIYWNFVNIFTSTFIYCCFSVQTSADISFHIFSYNCAVVFTQILRLHNPIIFKGNFCVCVCVCLVSIKQCFTFLHSSAEFCIKLWRWRQESTLPFQLYIKLIGTLCQRCEGAGNTLHPLANQNWVFAVVTVQVLIKLMDGTENTADGFQVVVVYAQQPVSAYLPSKPKNQRGLKVFYPLSQSDGTLGSVLVSTEGGGEENALSDK